MITVKFVFIHQYILVVDFDANKKEWLMDMITQEKSFWVTTPITTFFVDYSKLITAELV